MSESNCRSLPTLTESDIRRFWKYVDKRHPDECWPWIGARSDRGYGVFQVRSATLRACRVAFAIQNGRDPYPDLIRHSCDWSPCSNGTHLLTGTHDQNMQDASERGRMPTGEENGSRLYPERLKRGSTHGMSKLTEEIVARILVERHSGESLAVIAGRYDIDMTVVSKIYLGRLWAHVAGPRSKGARPSPFTDDIAKQIKIKRSQGRTYQSLAEEYGASLTGIYALVNGKAWSHVA